MLEVLGIIVLAVALFFSGIARGNRMSRPRPTPDERKRIRQIAKETGLPMSQVAAAFEEMKRNGTWDTPPT